MPKYYLKCGTVEIIFSTEQTPFEAAGRCLWESNKDDVLDEHFYIDEQGYRDPFSATPKTIVLTLKEVCKAEGWTLSNDQNTSRKPFVRKDLGQTRPAGLDASPYWATTYDTRPQATANIMPNLFRKKLFSFGTQLIPRNYLTYRLTLVDDTGMITI